MPPFISVTLIEPQMVDGKSFVNHYLEKATILANKQIEAVADATVESVRRFISEGIKRDASTGNLAASFMKEKTDDGWGVGNIEFLNKHAPYWRHINYGSFAIGANWRHKVRPGMFFPGEAQPDSMYAGEGNQGPDRWMSPVAGTGSLYSFIPTKAIKAHDYIEHTWNDVFSRIPNIIKNVK